VKIAVHLLRSLPPSCWNRSFQGAPKTAVIGGVRRAYVSSQAQKRAWREHIDVSGLLAEGDRALRTKQLPAAIASRVERILPAADPARILTAIPKVLAAGGFKVGDDGRTEYLVFLPTRALDKLAELVAEHLDALAPVGASGGAGDEKGDKAEPKKGKKAAKTEARSEIPDLRAAVMAVLEDVTRTSAIALSGRMIADERALHVEAAMQVAFAMSTHAVAGDFDDFVALDDVTREATGSSEMMGTIGFNSPCLYQYAAVDVRKLQETLGGERDYATKVLAAFLRAVVFAVPSGKQHTMAAHPPPSLVVVDVGTNPYQLSNAFEDPIRRTPSAHGGVVTSSILALAHYAHALGKTYGAGGRTELAFCLPEPPAVGLESPTETTLATAFAAALPTAVRRATMDELVDGVMAAAWGAAA
jgi:CRISPR system Cascade subunit CasC